MKGNGSGDAMGRRAAARVGRWWLGLALTLSGCTPPRSIPDVPDCMARPPWVESTAPDAASLASHVENHLGPVYRASRVCVSVDGVGVDVHVASLVRRPR